MNIDSGKLASANQFHEEWITSKKFNESLLETIELYKKMASQGDAEAMKKLNNFCQGKEPMPEALIARYELIEEGKIQYKRNANSKDIFFISRQPKTELPHLKLEICNAYEKQLKKRARDDIFWRIGILRYEGKFFEKNHFLARLLFKKAFEIGDKRAKYYYAFMCFYGEGGSIDCKEADSVFSTLGTLNEKPEEYFLMGEIFYLKYLYEIDEKSKSTELENSADDYEDKCCYFYSYAVENFNHVESLSSLYLMWAFDKSDKALHKLLSLYEEGNKNSVFSQIEMPEFDAHIQHYFPSSNDDSENNSDREKQDKLIDMEKILDKIPGNNPYLSKEKFDEIKKIAENNNQFALFLKAKYELKFYKKPYALMHLANNETSRENEINDLLFSYYKKSGEKGTFLLISSLCYEAKRHQWEELPCNRMRKILSMLDEKYSNYSKKDFYSELEEIERKNGEYYDEYPSDDSDTERQNDYSANDASLSSKTQDKEKLIEVTKIQPELKKGINSLEKITNDSMKAEDYKKEREKILQLFRNNVNAYYPKNNHKGQNKTKITEDVAVINHFNSQGNLKEALIQVSTKFVVAQTRGIHFSTDEERWSQENRRKYRKMVLQEDHPFKKNPIYSRAVYERAGVKDFNDTSEITQLRLEKIARYLKERMKKLERKPIEKFDDFIKNSTNITSFPGYSYFTSYNYQVQQLYSNNYEQFHHYIQTEMQQPDSTFICNKNPYLSTGDIHSIHSSRYAYGNKFYDSSKESRLRPKYQSDGKSLRSHTGAILLTLHPLQDYLNHNHISSLNAMAKLTIEKTIIPERECTFFSYIEKGRLKLINIAKYPSFHHENYLKIFILRYGITEDCFFKFKNLFQSTAPHSYKRKLTKLLLAEYLCAYQTILLIDEAVSEAAKMGAVLIYRDRFGNFSLKPICQDVSPTPNGTSDSDRCHRLYTKELRSKNNNNCSLLFSNSNSSSSLFSKNEQKRRKLNNENEPHESDNSNSDSDTDNNSLGCH